MSQKIWDVGVAVILFLAASQWVAEARVASEVQREIRNELQALNSTIADRIECVRQVGSGEADISFKKAK